MSTLGPLPDIHASPPAQQARAEPRSAEHQAAIDAALGETMKVRSTGLAHTLGQLYDSNRDFQSDRLAKMRLWANPVNFAFCRPWASRRGRRSTRS